MKAPGQVFRFIKSLQGAIFFIKEEFKLQAGEKLSVPAIGIEITVRGDIDKVLEYIEQKRPNLPTLLGSVDPNYRQNINRIIDKYLALFE